MSVSVKHNVRNDRRMPSKRLSALAMDADRTWMSATDPPGNPELLRESANLPPEEAARVVGQKMRDSAGRSLEVRLGALGIALGELTPNRAIPDGVYGLWRSELPMLLVTFKKRRQVPSSYLLAQQIGSLIFEPSSQVGGTQLSARFAQALIEQVPDLT